jgi:hypothetical protein
MKKTALPALVVSILWIFPVGGQAPVCSLHSSRLKRATASNAGGSVIRTRI